jgi:hypothetical protein
MNMKLHIGMCLATVGTMTLSGCGAAPVEASDSDVATSQQTITPSQEYVDSTGKVRIKIWECDPGLQGHHPTANCAVQDGSYVLVGGGARIVPDRAQAMLVGSYPCAPSSGLPLAWCAESKDHDVSQIHQVRAYAIGMKYSNYTPDQLRSNLRMNQASGSGTNLVSAQVANPKSFGINYDTILSGGAWATGWSQGLLLTQSEPTLYYDWYGHAIVSWLATAKAHVHADSGTVTSYVITMNPNLVRGLVFPEFTSSPQTGFGSVRYNASYYSGYVLTGIGAVAGYSGAGRMLTTIDPRGYMLSSGQYAIVESKDHEISDSGVTGIYPMLVQGI